VVPAREGLRPKFCNLITTAAFFVGEVVPAREGLRLLPPKWFRRSPRIGEVVPAREGFFV